MLALPATPVVAQPCWPAALVAAFSEVRGSAGAGSITYRLRLTNGGPVACTVSGRPGLRLLDRRGRALPTRVSPDHPGTGTAVLVTLKHLASAIADARFSPDVPGKGEPSNRACEPTATRVRVTLASPGSGRVTAPVRPATPVCEHGAIVEGLLHRPR